MTGTTASAEDEESLVVHRELWDWRRRVASLYASIRELEQPRLAWQLWRETRDGLFRNHPQSPLGADAQRRFEGLPLFDYDPSLRLAVDLVPASDAGPHSVPAGADGTVGLMPFARTRGLEDRVGGELTLYWMSGYGGGVFLPFQDATSGRQTFGGGRYVLDTIKSADLGQDAKGRTIVDFNFAYNPSCAYSDRWICPLSPPENQLPAAVRAGERMPA